MKVSLEAAFRDYLVYLVPSLRLGMLVLEAEPQDLRQSRYEVHFQPEAGNELLKGFHVKLTPMSFFCAPTRVVYLPENSCNSYCYYATPHFMVSALDMPAV